MVINVSVLLDILSGNSKYLKLSIMLWYLKIGLFKYTNSLRYFLLEQFFVWNVFVVYRSSSHVIIESSVILAKYLPFSQLKVAGFQIQGFFAHMIFFRMLQSHQYQSPFNFWLELHFPPSNLHLHSLDIYFFNVFDSFIPVITLKTLRFKSYVLFGTHIL